jgi:hypothetical protein
MSHQATISDYAVSCDQSSKGSAPQPRRRPPQGRSPPVLGRSEDDLATVLTTLFACVGDDGDDGDDTLFFIFKRVEEKSGFFCFPQSGFSLFLAAGAAVVRRRRQPDDARLLDRDGGGDRDPLHELTPTDCLFHM